MGEKRTPGQKKSGIHEYGISQSWIPIPDIQEKKIMAKVVPYGDAEAHGSLACSITFRRSRGKVILQKKPSVTQPNTPAQQEQKQRFKDGWKAYHALDAWAIEYLEKKAAELGTTKANLFLSQYLKDEIPSTDPLSLIKEIIDISLPEPAATEDDGLKIEPFSLIDIGEVETSYGDIYDKENDFTPGSISGAHQRELIRLSRTYDTPLDIPFNYPVIVTWKSFTDNEYVSLIRFPEMEVPGPTGPSDTPMTGIKEITTLNLIAPITGSAKTINFQFLTYKTSIQQYQGMGNIWDNENIFRPGVVADLYDKVFLQIDDIETPPSTIPEDYELEISYKDFADNMHHVHIKLPTFQLDAGTAPSANPLNNVKKITNMVIGRVIGADPDDWGNEMGDHIGTYPPYYERARVKDTANIFIFLSQTPSPRSMLIEWRKDPGDRSLIENYYITIDYDDFSDDPHTIRIWYPFTPNPGPGWIPFFIADDISLYEDLAMTTLIKPGDPNRKRLWIANDWSLYWDSDFLNLAKTFGAPPIDLWLADDFSLYWDKELTQLASTPFF